MLPESSSFCARVAHRALSRGFGCAGPPANSVSGAKDNPRTLLGVQRGIVGFVADDLGDWVALLECHHRQHVRHRPPFRSALWVVDRSERARRIGTTMNCPLCDRCELPDGLIVVRTTTTWDERTMPGALRRSHRVASGTWGRLRVEVGSLRFVARTDPITDVIVESELAQAIPPDVQHHIEPQGPTRFDIDFLGTAT
jgi:tellurite methyltransferase